MNIAYSLVGMTRGHASRALAVGAELLARGHDVRFFTHLDAYELLYARFGKQRVFEIEMPKYVFSKGKICLFSTLFHNARFVFLREKYTRPFIASFGRWRPHLTLSDFEPLAWWVSQKLHIPHVTLDSQRFMVSSEMPERLPFRDNIQRLAVELMLFCFSPSADLRLVSKPFATAKEHTSHHYIGSIIRQRVEQLAYRPSGQHFLCYLKAQLADHLPEIQRLAAQLGLKGRVYGLEATHLAAFPHLQYGETSEDGFLKSLSTCQFAITTPGSQTLAETAELGVSAYLLPEPNQFEQQINLHLAVQAAPDQYRKFQDASSVLESPLRSKRASGQRSNGRRKAVSLIESLAALDKDDLPWKKPSL